MKIKHYPNRNKILKVINMIYQKKVVEIAFAYGSSKEKEDKNDKINKHKILKRYKEWSNLMI